MKNVLITGVAGLLGSRFSTYLIENQNVNVVGIDDLSGGFKENINPKIIFIQQDVNNDLNEIFSKYNFDVVYHFAAYAAEGLSPFIRKFNYTNNLLSSANIINNCIKYSVNRLVFTSSLAIYGHGYVGIFDEEQIPKPIDPYGVAKYACEMDIQIAGEQHSLDWCIIRPHNVYGIGQNIWDKYRNVLGIWMFQTLNNTSMTIFGQGNQVRAFSFIDDILEPLYNAGISQKASKQIINLGGIEEYSILEANSILKKIMGKGDTIFLEPRHEVKISIPTYKKSEELLDFRHKISLEEGLEKMWQWAKVQPNRERFKWEKYELDNGIYEYWK